MNDYAGLFSENKKRKTSIRLKFTPRLTRNYRYHTQSLKFLANFGDF
jgi:hypothetical protein